MYLTVLFNPKRFKNFYYKVIINMKKITNRTARCLARVCAIAPMVLCVGFGMTMTAACLASPVDHLISKVINKSVKKTSELSVDPDETGYADFSGEWVGTCDDDPDRKDYLHIQTTSESIDMNGSLYQIDAVNSQSTKDNLTLIEIITHMHWNQDGSQLLATTLYYGLSGYMATGAMSTILSNMSMSKEDNQLVLRYSSVAYLNGVRKPDLDDKATCIYQPGDHSRL